MNNIVLGDVKIENLIYEIRGKQVMLDSDLARLYGCANGTKDINKAVKRNSERFPENFMFRLNNEEWSVLRFQSGTSNEKGGRRYKPFVFTCSLNKSVPLLYNALTKGEKLNNVEVKWYRTSTGGGQEHFFSTIFEDAVITDISLLMPNAQEPGNSEKTEQFQVSLNYRKIV